MEKFVFRKAWRDAISGCPEQVRREVYVAIIEYGCTGETSPLKAKAQMAFNIIRAQMDADAREEAKRAEASRRAETDARLVQEEKSERMRLLARRRWDKKQDDTEYMRAQCDRNAEEKETEKEKALSPLDSPTLKEKDKEKEFPPSTARTREESEDLQTDFLEDGYAKELGQSKSFREQTCMLLQISGDTFDKYWQDFLLEQRAKGTVHNGGFKDFRSHCVNWMLSHHDVEQQKGQQAWRRMSREEQNRLYYERVTKEAIDRINKQEEI